VGKKKKEDLLSAAAPLMRGITVKIGITAQTGGRQDFAPCTPLPTPFPPAWPFPSVANGAPASGTLPTGLQVAPCPPLPPIPPFMPFPPAPPLEEAPLAP